MNNKNIKIILIVIILILLFILGFVFFKKDDTVITPPIKEDDNNNPIEIKKGTKIYEDIYLNYENNKNILNMSSNSDYIIFTLEGSVNSSETLYYEIKLNYVDGRDGIYNDKLTFNLLELNGNEVKNNKELNSNIINDKIIYRGEIQESIINNKYKLEVIKSNENIEYKDIIVNISISTEKNEIKKLAKDTLLSAINLHPNTTWIDSDNVIYFQGGNNAIDYNYVWYSGKLWRITSIYPDGRIKLITDNMMSTIAWGKNIEFNGSWVYQWLNEDFFETLYNSSNILDLEATWNYTIDKGHIPSRPSSLPNQKTSNAPVGLISSYEYYVAGKNSSSDANYLNLNHRWWHITPQGSSSIRSTDNDGTQDLNERDPGKYERGIRPMIYLNKNIEFTGDGTKNNPYKIVGDIKNATSNDLLNSRISGEYVLFDNDLYRIIDIIDNHTKIIRVDYLRDTSNKKMEKHISRTITYGSPSNTQSDEWWDYYLINIWYPSISNNYRLMIVPGTYYMGEYSNNTHYKNTTCIDSNLDIVKTKSCNKYNDNKHIYVGNVGLSRIGEMFSAQQLDFESYPPSMWTITPFDYQENRIIHESNTLWRHKTWGGFHVVHPTIFLNENVKIVSGNGNSNNPFIIN